MIYQEAQLLVRDLIAAMPVDDLLLQRAGVSERLFTSLSAKAGEVGVMLDGAGLKDIMFPGALKQIFAQVVEARKGSLASLERARGETATLRHLANAAKLLDGNPSLVTLKTLEAMGTGRHTIVLGVPQAVLPLQRDVVPSPSEANPPHPPDSE